MKDSLLYKSGQNAVAAFDKLPMKALMFALLTVCYFGLVPNSNEEQYLALAKQYVDADWIPQSVNLTEFPGTRIVYQTVLGFVLQFIDFNSAVAIFRVLLILLMVWPIEKIYRELKFTNTDVLIHLGVLFIAHQSFFAGSFIFLSVEPKCFSYVAVFWALYFMMKSKQAAMVACLIAATYLHALVGFWSAFYILTSQVLFGKLSWPSLKAPVISGIVYAALILPFVIYLTGAIEEAAEQSPTADWIYTYFRSPHHTALAPDISYFYQNHFYGVLWTVVAVLFILDLLRNKRLNFNSKITQFSFVALSGSVLLVGLAFVDRQGSFLKYYPYRIMSVATFCLFLAMTKQLTTLLAPFGKVRILVYALAVSGAMLLEVIIPNLKLNAAYLTNQDKNLIAATDFIKTHSEKDDVVLTLFEDDRMIRLTERNAFASYKFVPAEKARLHDWYRRVLASREMMENPGSLSDYSKVYRIDYIIADEPLEPTIAGQVIFQSGPYAVYTLEMAPDADSLR